MNRWGFREKWQRRLKMRVSLNTKVVRCARRSIYEQQSNVVGQGSLRTPLSAKISRRLNSIFLRFELQKE